MKKKLSNISHAIFYHSKYIKMKFI